MIFLLAIITFFVLTLVFEGLDRWDNLPDHIDSPAEWNNKDDDKHWYTKWKKQLKSWFAYSWTQRHWFGKLRKSPITLLALFGRGDSRWENDLLAIRSVNDVVMLYWPLRGGFYLSRVQYYCDWHLMISWPFFIGFHVKYGKKGLVNAYFGMKRDTDAYWFPSLYIGTSWK